MSRRRDRDGLFVEIAKEIVEGFIDFNVHIDDDVNRIQLDVHTAAEKSRADCENQNAWSHGR